MIISFTEQEKEYLDIKTDGPYRLWHKSETPEDIARSIEDKIKAHEKWIKESHAPDMKEVKA